MITANVKIIAHCASPTTKPSISGHHQTPTCSITCTYTMLTNSRIHSQSLHTLNPSLSFSYNSETALLDCLFIRKPPGYIGDFSCDFPLRPNSNPAPPPGPKTSHTKKELQRTEACPNRHQLVRTEPNLYSGQNVTDAKRPNTSSNTDNVENKIRARPQAMPTPYTELHRRNRYAIGSAET